jgi:hypothetical protein
MPASVQGSLVVGEAPVRCLSMNDAFPPRGSGRGDICANWDDAQSAKTANHTHTRRIRPLALLRRSRNLAKLLQP